jgi:hypothetical protein
MHNNKSTYGKLDATCAGKNISSNKTATDIRDAQLNTNHNYVRFEVFTAVIMKNPVFWDIKNPVPTSLETHHVSATGPSWLMLCKIEVFTAVTMKNVIFWDIKLPFVPHRGHIVSPLQSPTGECYVRLRFSWR